jgi:DNA polymerase III subunit epsilon
MYLAFDTETTDIPRPSFAPDHASQPCLLQFAGILFDESGAELDRLVTMVRPGPDASLSPHAYAAHGISLEYAFHIGVEVSQVLNWFLAAATRSTCIIGHNVQFDLQMMAIVAARASEDGWSTPPRTFCTMAHSTPMLNLPPTPRMVAAGRYHPKSPTLSECIEHFFGEKHSGAHDAEADVRACIRIFRHLNQEKKSLNQ